jgi:hypothetical protein
MGMFEQGRSRDVRAAINENTFREINEQLVAAVALDAAGDELHDVVCECARVDCTELVTVSVQEYDGVREEGGRYWIVEKVGPAGDIADALDPRDR